MKFFVVLACVLAASNALEKEFVEKFMEKMQKIGEICTEETGASADDIAELLAHKVPSSHEGKCMIFCFHKNFQIQNADGSLNPEGAFASIQPLKEADPDMYNKVHEVFEVCGKSAVIDADPCVTATGLAECAVKEGKARGLSENMFEV